MVYRTGGPAEFLRSHLKCEKCLTLKVVAPDGTPLLLLLSASLTLALTEPMIRDPVGEHRKDAPRQDAKGCG